MKTVLQYHQLFLYLLIAIATALFEQLEKSSYELIVQQHLHQGILIMQLIPLCFVGQQNKGVLAALSEFPDVNVVGQLAHNWTSQVAQKELSQWLSTNTKKVDGIAVQSS